jgi:hypothetical protein
VGKAASEYLVEAVYMTKAVLHGQATQLIDLARLISSADGGREQRHDGHELQLFDFSVALPRQSTSL